MAKITSASSLTATEVTIDPASKTIKLNIAGVLNADGVSMRTLYAYLKQQWNTLAVLLGYPFPLVAVTDVKYDLVYGWDFKDIATRNLIRDAGWSVKNPSDNLTSYEEWMNVNTVGVVGATDQIYYTQSGAAGSSTGTLMPYAGAANYAVKIYGDSTHGAFDYRSNFTIYVREQGKLYDQESIASIGVSTLSYTSYFFPLDSVLDTNIVSSDTMIDTNMPYSGMSITYFSTPVARIINGTSCNFNTVINANNGTRAQVYEYVQRQLRKVTDIDAGTGIKLGKTTTSLVKMLGNTLVTNTGVYIDNLAATEADFVDYYDNTSVKRNLPYQAAGTIQFNSILTNDIDAVYRVYFSSSFGTSSALLVKDVSGADIAGSVYGKNSITFSFDYDSNVQGGRSPSTDVNITIVAIGITSGQYTLITGIISRSISNRYFLSSAAERNYIAV